MFQNIRSLVMAVTSADAELIDVTNDGQNEPGYNVTVNSGIGGESAYYTAIFNEDESILSLYSDAKNGKKICTVPVQRYDEVL